MHGYLPRPDVYIKCLCNSTEFFLERATKRNEIISGQRPEGRLSPFVRLLLPAVARWQEIPPLSLDMPLSWPLSGLQPSAIGGFSLRALHKLCKLQVPGGPGTDSQRRPWPPHLGSANRADRALGSEGRAFQISSRSSTAGVETRELRKLRPLLSPGMNRVPGREHSPHPSPAAAYLAPTGAHADRSAIHAVLPLRQQRVGARPVGPAARLRSPQAHGGGRRLRHDPGPACTHHVTGGPPPPR